MLAIHCLVPLERLGVTGLTTLPLCCVPVSLSLERVTALVPEWSNRRQHFKVQCLDRWWYGVPLLT